MLRAGSKLLWLVKHAAFLFLEQRFLSAFPRLCLQRKMLWKWGSRAWVSHTLQQLRALFVLWYIKKKVFKLLFLLQFQQQKCRPRGEVSTVGRNSCTWNTQVWGRKETAVLCHCVVWSGHCCEWEVRGELVWMNQKEHPQSLAGSRMEDARCAVLGPCTLFLETLRELNLLTQQPLYSSSHLPVLVIAVYPPYCTV